MDFLSIENVFVNIGVYQMSYLEFIGTLLYLMSVFLISIRNIWTWPIGIVSVVLYMYLFIQIQLYSDALEQVWYLLVSIYGWIFWSREPYAKGSNYSFSSRRSISKSIVVIFIGGSILGVLVSKIHIYLPRFFPEPATYVFVDSFTTSASFVAMFLLAKRRIESWIIWITVDIVAIWLYLAKGVVFLSGLYVLLTLLACNGLYNWMRQSKLEDAFR